MVGYGEYGTPTHSLLTMKSYVDGPDVDVNFAILDGEVLFFDVLDNFPSAGDMTGGTPGNNDLPETMFVFLCVFPSSEQDLLAASLRNSVLDMDFCTGMFHCEGRV